MLKSTLLFYVVAMTLKTIKIIAPIMYPDAGYKLFFSLGGLRLPFINN
jgi:hypothetical protein